MLLLNALNIIGLIGIGISMLLLCIGYIPIDRQMCKMANSLNESSQENEKLKRQLDHLRERYGKMTSSNEMLRERLLNKNSLLKYTSEELVRHNGELMQFSFTVSHNLRAPVAALKGLLTAINSTEQNEGKIDLLSKFHDVAENLDEIVHELNDITGIRNDVYKKKEIISLKEVAENALKTYKEEISASDAEINLDISAKVHMFTNKPALEGILSNLIGNALTHRKPSEAPRIVISNEKTEGGTIIRIKDFGKGIDLEKYGEKLFKLYSRINWDVEGRGTGLYISKLMADSIGAKITVESQVGEWTEFKLMLKHSHDDSSEVLFENDAVVIDLNKESNQLEMKWNNNIRFGDFKEACINVNSLIAQYANEKLVIDVSDSPIPSEFISWVRTNIIPILSSSLLDVRLVSNPEHIKKIEAELLLCADALGKRHTRASIVEKDPVA